MLDDLLDRNLALVICGTASGRRSAQLNQYYAGPGNRFWPTLATVGLTPRELSPADYRELLAFGIGLTDLAKRQAGGDDELRFAKADAMALRARIILYQPRYLCFNGKRGAREFLGVPAAGYGVQTQRIGRTVLFIAPSTSRAANASWDVSVWHDLAARVRGHQPRRVASVHDNDRRFTALQGQYLTFIHLYTKLHGSAPAEADMQAYFQVTPPSVHAMVVALEARRLITRVPGQARSIKLLVPADALPALQ